MTVRLWGPLLLRAEAGSLFALARPRYADRRLDPDTLALVNIETYRVPVVGASAALGLGARF